MRGISYFKETARLKLEGHWRDAVGYSLILLAMCLIAGLLLSRYIGAGNAGAAIAGVSAAFIIRLLILLFVYGALLHFLKLVRINEIETDANGIMRDKWGRPVKISGENSDNQHNGSPESRLSADNDYSAAGYGSRNFNENGGPAQVQQDRNRREYNIPAAAGNESSGSVLNDLAAPFKMQPDRFIMYGIFTGLLELISVVPLIAAGYLSRGTVSDWIAAGLISAWLMILSVYLRLSWALTPLILLDAKGEITVVAAMKKSRSVMKGKKKKLFLLALSFIGWILLVPLTLGFGLLWIAPYAGTSYCAFYDSVTGFASA